MKKKKFFKVTSFVLSVVMLMFSLPTAASSLEEMTTEKMTEVALAETRETETMESVTDSRYYEWEEESRARVL